VALIAPFSASLAAVVGALVSNGEGMALSIWALCVAQILFFFTSSVCQAAFLVVQQLVAVIVQAVVQIGLIVALYSTAGISYGDAMAALTMGYGVAASFMLFSIYKNLRVSASLFDFFRFKFDVRSVYGYGSALAPWLLGMLVMAAADRLAIGHLQVFGGDAYLSLKDLFVGAGGLLSMPLLMLVHPLIIKRFREGVFESVLIQTSMSFLIIVFSLLWVTLVVVGFPLFERFTNKPIDVSVGVLLVVYVGVFLNCAAVYVQKRLEVHRKMRSLALLSLCCSLVSVGGAYAGAFAGGVGGAAVGVLAGQLMYFVFVGKSIIRKVSFYRGCVRPFAVSLCMISVGYSLNSLIGLTLPEMAWWVGEAVWSVVFGLLSMVVLWKGVAWADFASARL